MKLASPKALPPKAPARPVTLVQHNLARTDDYAWLRAENWQEVMRAPETLSKDIREYLEAENGWTEAVMAPTKALQEALVKEMRGRIKEDDSSVPSPDGPFEYYTRFRHGGEHPLVCRRPRGAGDNGPETVLIDGDALAKGHPYFQLGAAEHSHDHRLLAYATDTSGAEIYKIEVREIETGRPLDDAIDDTAGDLEWLPDNSGFYYVRRDEEHRPRTILFHRLGTPPSADRIIYHEEDPGFFVSMGLTEEHDFLLISSHDHQTSEVWVMPGNEPEAAPRLVAKRRADIEYDISQLGRTFLIVTNDHGAEDFKLMSAPVDSPGPENWTEVIAHRPGVLLSGIDVTKRHLARIEREAALPRIIVTTIREVAPGKVELGAEERIAFDEEAYSLGISSGYEFDTDTLRFRYASPTTPASVFDYDMTAKTRTLRKVQEVPSGHDPSAYVARRIHAVAEDGERIPITLLYRRDLTPTQETPLLLYGYGSYGISMPADFSVIRLSLVDRGFVYAIAHIRGGMDGGYRWYKQGRRDRKITTFTDYIAAAKHLIAEGFTGEGHIIAHGGSAGGLLVGAVLNMAPGLFLGAIADVPFVDCLNTMLDASLPLTPPEWNEWGNPIEDVKAFELIRSYAPYENVRTQNYPHILVTAGLSDPRVTYWEPAKWVAKLRALKTDGNHLLLKTNMEAGHGGASGRFDSLKEDALAYAFALSIAERA